MKKIIIISIWVILIVGLIAGLIFSGIFHQNRTCKAVEIDINYASADPFFTAEDINSFLIQKNDSIKGKKISEINENLIENIIKENPYIIDADVFTTMDGILKINITQRKAIVRIINKMNQQFYLDNLGVKMPINNKYPANVVIATGNINAYYSLFSPSDLNQRDDTLNLMKDSIFYGIYKVADYISKNMFLKAQIEQIYMNENSEIELIPKLGEQIIIFGNAENIEEKFNKLLIIYKEAFNKLGWDKYKLINLTYENQVVCTKNILK
ncbi:MAG: cell division protein FtsQ/DivIB [Bacteroidales bacterium]